jgi:predicted amidohydrolase
MELNTKKSLKVVSIQVNPIRCSLDENMERCRKLLDLKLKSNPDPDVIIFPETAMSGYIMNSKKEINSMSEICGQGKQFEYYQKIALEYKSYVIAGYYEKMTQEQINSSKEGKKNKK